MNTAVSWTCSVKGSKHYEVPTYQQIDSMTIEKLTVRQRSAKQCDTITPKLPKPPTEAEPGEAAPQGKAKAKPRAKAGPKPLSESAKKHVERMQMNLQGLVQQSEDEMKDFDPTHNGNDRDVPKRHLEGLAEAEHEAKELDDILNTILTEGHMVEDMTMTVLRLKVGTAMEKLETKYNQVKSARAD